jgi:hypothetical protein
MCTRCAPAGASWRQPCQPGSSQMGPLLRLEPLLLHRPAWMLPGSLLVAWIRCVNVRSHAVAVAAAAAPVSRSHGCWQRPVTLPAQVLRFEASCQPHLLGASGGLQSPSHRRCRWHAHMPSQLRRPGKDGQLKVSGILCSICVYFTSVVFFLASPWQCSVTMTPSASSTHSCASGAPRRRRRRPPAGSCDRISVGHCRPPRAFVLAGIYPMLRPTCFVLLFSVFQRQLNRLQHVQVAFAKAYFYTFLQQNPSVCPTA